MEVRLRWAPSPDIDTVAQRVQYRKDNQQVWVTAATVGPTVSQYDVSGLDDNWLYYFRVINVCNSGGVSTSNITEQAQVFCGYTLSLFLTATGDIEYVFHVDPSSGVNLHKLVLYRQDGTEVASNDHVRRPGDVEIRGSFTGLAPDPQYRLLKIDMVNENIKAPCGAVNVQVCQEVSSIGAILTLVGGARKLVLNWTPSVTAGVPNKGYRIRYKAFSDTVYKVILIPRLPNVGNYIVETLTQAEQDGVEGFIDAMCSDTEFVSKAFVSIMV